jgi:hypothetical protein
MALPNYLSLVNDVMVRLREPEVTTVNENNLSKLIGKFINDSKRQVEDAYRWNSLSTTIVRNTTVGTPTYTLTGVNQRFKVINVYNNTSKTYLHNISRTQMNDYLLSENTPQTATPMFYTFNGVDSNGNTKVDVYPVPDKVYSLRFNIFNPQSNLSGDSQTMVVPDEPVVQLAYAKALVERGEDGGLQSSEAYALFKQVLADYIAIESGRYVEEEVWVTV